MSELNQIRELASELNIHFAGQLRHDRHVEPLANRWKPIIFFHEKERFHPVGMEGLVSIPRQVFDAAGPGGQADIQVQVDVPDVGGATIERDFHPPALHSPNPNGDGRIVHNEEDNTLVPFGLPEIGEKTILTHGPGFTPSNSIFGSLETVSGLEEPSAGDPRSPRHPIEVDAEFRMALEWLRFMLEVDAKESNEYPKKHDSIWNEMWVKRLFFVEKDDLSGSPQALDGLTEEKAREILLGVIRGEMAPGMPDTAAQDAALDQLPDGVMLNNEVFETTRNAAFLEFQFIYAYNDWDKYENWPANYHEGDDEGCCLVFDRRTLEDLAEAGDDVSLVETPPLYIITSVHLASQGADKISEFNVLNQNAVYAALGSHATYLKPGRHDPADAGVAFEEAFRGTPLWLTIPTLGVAAVLAGLLGIAYDHFAGPKDDTSNDGIAGGEADQFPAGTPGDRLSPVELEINPTSVDLDQMFDGDQPSPEESGLLGLRSYSGLLGAHKKSRGRTSPKYKRKFDRYFTKMIRSGYQV